MHFHQSYEMFEKRKKNTNVAVKLHYSFLTSIIYDVLTLLDVHVTGLPCGPSDQICPLPWPVQQLPDQAVLHVQHPHHPAVGARLQPLHHLAGASRKFAWDAGKLSPEESH